MTPEARLWREVSFLIIEDYLRNISYEKGKKAAIFVEAKDFIYGAKRDYFNGICSSADLCPHWVRRRINEFLEKNHRTGLWWRYTPNLAKRILGLYAFKDTVLYHKRRGRAPKLVKF